MSLTTRQKEAAALAIPCPWHQRAAGEPCPPTLAISGPACSARRESALDHTGTPVPSPREETPQ